LRNDEQSTVGFLQIEIHLAGGVGEDSQTDYPIGQKTSIQFGIVIGYSEQDQESCADAAQLRAISSNGSFRNPLYDRSQS
jgi:hypothetical protein